MLLSDTSTAATNSNTSKPWSSVFNQLPSSQSMKLTTLESVFSFS